MLRDTSGQDRAITPSKNKRWPFLVGIAGLGLVVGLALTLPAMSSLFSADMTVNAERLRFAVVERGNIQRDISVQGQIVASNSPTLYARSPGVINLNAKPGDQVKQGQLLATIESPELNSRYQQELAVLEQQQIEVGRFRIQIKTDLLDSQQNIEQSNVDLEVAKVNKSRADVSIEDSLISQREFEEISAVFQRAALTHKHAKEQYLLQQERLNFELQSRQSELARQEFVVDELKRQVDELRLFAPASGIIGSVNVRERDTVAANTALITLIDLSAFEVEVSIPESYADDLTVGLTSEITFNGKEFPGELVAISPEVNQGQVIGRIRFAQSTIANLRQNQRVSARLMMESRNNVLKIRRGAFVESGGGRLAFVRQGDVASRRDIQLGVQSLAEVEIVAGLSEGEEVVISSLDNIKQQQHIYIAN